MSIEPVKKLLRNRLILASLVIAGSMIGAALWQETGDGETWTVTAVYMLGIFGAAWIMMPMVKEERWLWITAVLMALTIVLPGAILNREQWASTQLQNLGSTANTLFLVLMLSTTQQPSRYADKKWIITGVYVLIMLILTILL
jgi:hypothetical protein